MLQVLLYGLIEQRVRLSRAAPLTLCLDPVSRVFQAVLTGCDDASDGEHPQAVPTVSLALSA